MIEGAGSAGPRAVRGLMLRSQTERWARDIIRRVRADKLAVPDDSAVRAIASHRDSNGRLMRVDTAAVELINVLRPTVAVNRYIMFAALALHQHPECRERLLAADDDAYPERFEHRKPGTFDLIPQGAGDHHLDHRCAGEWITIELIKCAVRQLTRQMRYDVPAQDLHINLSRMPALPRSGFVIENVRRLLRPGLDELVALTHAVEPAHRSGFIQS